MHTMNHATFILYFTHFIISLSVLAIAANYENIRMMKGKCLSVEEQIYILTFDLYACFDSVQY